MEDRKPRETRFGTESGEARLAHLREQAPTLGSSRKLRIYAIFGSLLMVLAVAAFYFAMQIYKVVTEDREQSSLIEVDPAGDIPETETQKALARIEAEEAASDTAYREQLDALKEMDVLEGLDNPEN